MLNINDGSTEDFKPYIKYNAKAGRWYSRKDGEEVEVLNPTFVADLDNIKTAWMYFAAGIAPNIVYDPSLSVQSPKPSDDHKKGFEFNVFSQLQLGGVCVFSSTSGIVGGVIKDLYSQYEAEKAANVGSLPVIECSGVTPETGKHGTNYRPKMKIVKWTKRPDAFDDVSYVETAPTQQAAETAPDVVVSNSVSEF